MFLDKGDDKGEEGLRYGDDEGLWLSDNGATKGGRIIEVQSATTECKNKALVPALVAKSTISVGAVDKSLLPQCTRE